MKNKILFLIFNFIFLISFVTAKDNRLYFTNSGNRLYYSSNLFDEDIFMNHTDMIPGSSYEDELIIENNTETEYRLYLKVNKKEQSILSDELLSNIEMKIYLDGKLIYDGYALGIDYSNNGINLQNAIYIGKYEPNVSSNLLVETRLNPEYSNTENNDYSYIDWIFYANYEDDIIIINPDTGDEAFFYLKISFCILYILLVTIIYKSHQYEQWYKNI